MSSADITLKEIIIRRMRFIREGLDESSPDDFDSRDPFSLSYDEFKAQCDGELRAYGEMLTALNCGLPEDEFVDFFFGQMETWEQISRAADSSDNVIDFRTGRAKNDLVMIEAGGYCAAAKEILGLFLPVYTDEDFE